MRFFDDFFCFTLFLQFFACSLPLFSSLLGVVMAFCLTSPLCDNGGLHLLKHHKNSSPPLFFEVREYISANLHQRNLAQLGVVLGRQDALLGIEQALLCFAHIDTREFS